MIRKFNYTHRKRIKFHDVQLNLREEDENIFVNVDLSGISSYGFPTDSLVFLEAYRQTYWMRFFYGTFDKVGTFREFQLNEFESDEGIKFRVKVTASDDARIILGEADRIKIKQKNEKEIELDPLLPVIPKELGNEIYRVDFSGDYPVLLINSKAGNYRNIGRSNEFLSLVYPAVFREILTKILIIESHGMDDLQNDWENKWLKFATSFPGVDEVPKQEDENTEEWIQNVVSVFSRRMSLLHKFDVFWRE